MVSKRSHHLCSKTRGSFQAPSFAMSKLYTAELWNSKIGTGFGSHWRGVVKEKLLMWRSIISRLYHMGEEELAEDTLVMATAVDYTSEEVSELLRELYSCTFGFTLVMGPRF